MLRMLNKHQTTTGGQATSRARMPARRYLTAGLALACLGAASPTVAEVAIKLGPTGISNWSSEARLGTVGIRQMGGHVAIDYAVPDWPVTVAPFVDVYHRSGKGDLPRTNQSTNVIGGVDFLVFSEPRGHDMATMYMGVGGGVARMKVGTGPNDAGEPTTGYKVKPIVDALMGVEVEVARTVSVYFEPKYLWAPNMMNGVSASGGVVFFLGRAKPAAPLSSAAPVYVPAPPAPPVAMAVEQPKARTVDLDSLNRARQQETMQQMVYFAYDQAELDDQAKAILTDKVVLLRTHPAMRVLIVGFASQPGTDAYNMDLGMQRAAAAKAYLVSQGIDGRRIEVATRGEGQLLVEGPGDLANAANQRNQFRLLIAEPVAASATK